MNAPFKAAAGSRDPFQAYVCDEHSLDLLRVVAQELGWPIERVNKGGLRNAVQALSMAPSPNVLFVDLSGIGRSAQRHQRPRRGLRAGHRRDRQRPGQRRAPLSRPASPAASRIICSSRSTSTRCAMRSATAQMPCSTRPRSRRTTIVRTVMVSVIGTRGGVGASTVVNSLAYLTSKDKRQTALLDLDVHFGTGALSARPRAGPRPDRCGRESEPHRRPVHRARHGARERHAGDPVGRSADQPAAAHRWFSLFPARGRAAGRLRVHLRRPAAQHARAAPASDPRHPRRSCW